jgi:hypothetical protein
LLWPTIFGVVGVLLAVAIFLIPLNFDASLIVGLYLFWLYCFFTGTAALISAVLFAGQKRWRSIISLVPLPLLIIVGWKAGRHESANADALRLAREKFAILREINDKPDDGARFVIFDWGGGPLVGFDVAPRFYPAVSSLLAFGLPG